MANNSEAWSQTKVVEYFNSNRNKISDVYQSEWFFLKEQLKDGITILDIGCAQGGFAEIIDDQIKSFCYTGIDISSSMIAIAKAKQPQHTFHCVSDNDYSCLKNDKFDLTIVLGILHLNEEWRKTIKSAWQRTSSCLILDLRETNLASIEDKTKSYFKMNINGAIDSFNEVLPYNVINVSEALNEVTSICSEASKISHYGYSQTPSSVAVCPVEKVFANVYCIER
jgi:2-polyprenyl-3-methyl-5-hydroxy-6-metoxy-1,4-benzoquinol methylase